jgi:hypothetical protein
MLFMASTNNACRPFENEVKVVNGLSLLDNNRIRRVFQEETFTGKHIFASCRNSLEQQAIFEQLDDFTD